MNGKTKIPRIICVGSNLESKISLEALVNSKANIVAIVTRPSGESGGISDYIDLHEYCKQNKIKSIDTKNINSLQTLSEIENERPDYIFTLGWSQLFKEKLLAIPTKFIIGSHPSILPSGKGRAPVPWSILENLRKSGVSFFKMDLGADSGELLHQEFFSIPSNSYAIDVYNLVANSLSKGFIAIYNKILGNKLSVIKNPDIPVSYRSRRSSEDGLIDFNKSTEEIDRLIRAVSYPYPGAFTYYQNTIVKIWRCSLKNIPVYSAISGQILEKKDNSLLVCANNSAIWLKEFTDIYGNEINISNFKVGSKFGYQVENEIFKLRQEIKELKKGYKE